MSLEWVRESPTWNAEKRAIVGDAPVGIFDRRYSTLKVDDVAPGEWWRVQESGAVVGYGWFDVVWGDAEILLVVAPGAQKRGIGRFILDNLTQEAASRGLNYVYNIVRPSHPQAEQVTAWLAKRGFRPGQDGCLMRASRQ